VIRADGENVRRREGGENKGRKIREKDWKRKGEW
jgi:hypothetical protein